MYGKNYFSKNNTELNNSIELRAKVSHNGQELAAAGLQYYWILKDDNITEESEYYLPFVGKGWKCLNSFENVTGLLTHDNGKTWQVIKETFVQ